MKKLLFLSLLMALFAGPMLALPMLPGPMVFPAVLMFSATFLATAKNILLLGTTIFTVIEGLKNVPVFADLFVKWPMLAVVLNAVLSLLVTLGTCFAMGQLSNDFITCVLTALGVFLGAAGIHLVKVNIASRTTRSPSARVAPPQN